MKFTIGSSEIKTEWVHVDNLVSGHLLGAEALSERKGYISVSQVLCTLQFRLDGTKNKWGK